MRIAALRSRLVRIPLTRPYAIAGGSWDKVEMVLVELEGDDGTLAYGQASPAEEVTGESAEQAARALAPTRLEWLIGRELGEFEALKLELQQRIDGPATRAGVDMALHDLASRAAGKPLVEWLGRAHGSLRTSITIGLKSVSETLAEADEYVARGFALLKVKTGADIELDLERLAKLRERFGARVELRIDANQGYDLAAFRKLAARADVLDLALIEQPMRPELDGELAAFASLRARLVADESVHSTRDLARLASCGSPYGGLNVKLMKSGGPGGALELARAAQAAGYRLLWGCMDESVLGIAAALHCALALRATAWLDLDGSFDLARDPFRGGFALERDRLSTLARVGLGAELAL
ncbi:MAG: dipeptide epimerase [Planctomycetes bacterium]|nr:dipeptide epimerase [Planctomycetota bacterium]